MKIGIISDTHTSRGTNQIPSEVYDCFRGVDLILHAGDLIELGVLDKLGKIAPVKAVFGNMDPVQLKKKLSKNEIIKAGKFTIALMHGLGPPMGLRERVKEAFREKDVDCIVYGHSHAPLNMVDDGILFFNPGSPTDEVYAPYKSCGILYIKDEIKGEIIKLGEKR